MAASNQAEYQGWIRDEDEGQTRLTLRRRSTGATITATRAGVSFEGNHQNATSVEDGETVDVLREVVHFYDDVTAAYNVGLKAQKAAIDARREQRTGSAGSSDKPASASQPAAAKGG